VRGQDSHDSDTVLSTLLSLAGRHQHMLGVELLAIRTGLMAAVDVVDRLLPSREQL
jgi:hypothetical protein